MAVWLYVHLGRINFHENILSNLWMEKGETGVINHYYVRQEFQDVAQHPVTDPEQAASLNVIQSTMLLRVYFIL